ncbi:MAG: dioxygenase, partial [Dokdonella sp.]
HNLSEFFATNEQTVRASEQFDGALTQAVEHADPAARDAHLIAWKQMPAALACHPRAEHLLPLMVVAGAAGGDRGRRTYNDRIFGKPVSGFQFG